MARYVLELARAIEELDSSRVTAYLLNPDLALPGGIEPLVAAGKLRFVDEAEYPDGALLHLASPFELSVPLDRLLPPPARRPEVRLAVTLFDLIPEAMPDQYLQDPGLRRRYRARRELVRQADHVIAISAETAAEARRRLGVAPRRLSVVALAPAPRFRPPASRDAAIRAARAALPALAQHFVLYTGGSDPRKNVEGLLEAWSRLPHSLRQRWQLVLACHLPPLQQNHLEVRAGELGFGSGFLVTGRVAEDTLIALYQGTGLFVFPSRAEGFGLPVTEALACGAATIGSEVPSVRDLLAPDAAFDPCSPGAMAAAISRALTDEGFRRRLLDWASRPPRTWAEVAAETLDVYDRVTRPPPSARRRAPGPFRLALATPLPPQPGGVADYSTRLLEELRELVTVDAFVDGPPHLRAAVEAAEVPEGVGVHPLGSLARCEAAGSPYDSVVYSIGNSEFHTGALAWLGRRPGVVLAHDVRLTNLYRFAAWQHPEAVPGGFHSTLQRMYAGRVPVDLGGEGFVDPEEAERWGVLMARDVIAGCQRFLATSPFAAALAHLDARPGDRHRIAVLPFSVGAVPLADPTPPSGRPGPPVLASFGVVNVLKQGPLLVDAFAAFAAGTEARLAFVGPASDADRAAVVRRAGELGVAGRVEVTGELDDDGYRRWLDRAWVAVQLRSSTNGESSGAVGDCLTAGIPTIATAIGPNRALPGDAVVTVPTGVGVGQLAALLTDLVGDEARRAALAAGARRYAGEHSFRRAAEALFAYVSSRD